MVAVATRPLLVVGAALIDADGRVLLAQRPAGKADAGLWEFPGGKVEGGEGLEEALVRELREELGIETEESCLAPLGFGTRSDEHRRLLLCVFACRKWRGTPRALEGQALEWCPPRDLLRYDMPVVDRPIAAQLRDLLCG